MARRGRGRRPNWSKFVRGQIDTDIPLGTLAAKTGKGEAASQTVVDTARLSSIRCTYSLSNYTPLVNAGPLHVYVAHSDYSDPEIEAFVENQGGWDLGNMTAREVGSRRIRYVGVFEAPANSSEFTYLNDGKPIKTKLNWQLTEGDTVRFFVFNSGNSSVGTTDPNVMIFGTANIWYN